MVKHILVFPCQDWCHDMPAAGVKFCCCRFLSWCQDWCRDIFVAAAVQNSDLIIARVFVERIIVCDLLRILRRIYWEDFIINWFVISRKFSMVSILVPWFLEISFIRLKLIYFEGPVAAVFKSYKYKAANPNLGVDERLRKYSLFRVFVWS